MLTSSKIKPYVALALAHIMMPPQNGSTCTHACLLLHAGVTNLVQKGYKKMSPFFIPYAITNMGGALVAIDQVSTHISTQ